MTFSMKNIRTIFAILCVLFFVQKNFAQPRNEKMEALRVSYINKKLELTPNEIEKFWPVYNEYHAKLDALKKNLRQSFRKRSVTMTEKEAEELYYLDLQTKQAELDLYKQYTEKIKEIIGTTKCVKLKIAEVEFKHEMIKSLKDRHERVPD